MPKRYLVFKWVIYVIATFLLLQVQTWVLDHVEVWGVTAFLAPMMVGVVASYEGSLAGPLFALGFGVLCDLGTASPAAAFFTFTFTAAALAAALMAEHLFSPGFLCSLASTTVCYLITALGRLLLLGSGAWEVGAYVALREFLVTLPLLLVVFPVYRWVHNKTTIEY